MPRILDPVRWREGATFGIEIETLAPLSALTDGFAPGRYHCGNRVPFLPSGWKAERDGSLSTTLPGYTPCEFVSPVLQGPDGVKQIMESAKKIKERGFIVNPTCGVHVHIGFPRSLFGDSRMQHIDGVKTLIQSVSYLQTALYAITGTRKRQEGNFCKPIRRFGDVESAFREMIRSRYFLLNITNVPDRARETVEFRVFSGSLNPVKLAAWTQVALGIVERAVSATRATKWEPRRACGGWRKDGVGQEDVERLIAYLGWTPAAARIRRGLHHGWLCNDLSRDEVNKELRRLAKKYDDDLRENR
ncbi:MAG: amidoligase family protein [Thermoguttaceae bacterium]|nr:amidoligase family protein [Thermoguttaceae bacterium]